MFTLYYITVFKCIIIKWFLIAFVLYFFFLTFYISIIIGNYFFSTLRI